MPADNPAHQRAFDTMTRTRRAWQMETRSKRLREAVEAYGSAREDFGRQANGYAPAALKAAEDELFAAVESFSGRRVRPAAPASIDEDAILHDPQDDDWLDEPIICDD